MSCGKLLVELRDTVGHPFVDCVQVHRCSVLNSLGNHSQGKNEIRRAHEPQRGVPTIFVLDYYPPQAELLREYIAENDPQRLQLPGLVWGENFRVDNLLKQLQIRYVARECWREVKPAGERVNEGALSRDAIGRPVRERRTAVLAEHRSWLRSGEV